MHSPESNLYYIYIDTKIDGAIDQLLSYFQSAIFSTQQCIAVYCKYYKEIEKKYAAKFKKYGIRFKYISKNSDLVFEDNKIVFYLFNSQSNCRVVAHRNVTHIFVTHGESNKISSIKPIIRIYDYVVTAGQAGVERYLKSGLFNEHDVDHRRIIQLGNTFIGQNQYKYVPQSATLLYAPTWEGGLPQENYCSIGDQALVILSQYIKANNIRRLVIQPHPNLGHRDCEYIVRLTRFIEEILKLKIDVILRKKALSWSEKLFRKNGIKYQITSHPCAVSAAYVDISAMEVQLLAKNIPTMVLCKKRILEQLLLPQKVYDYYITHGVQLLEGQLKAMVSLQEIHSIRDYFITYSEPNLQSLGFQQRISWLCHQAKEWQSDEIELCLSKY